ncbi:hypothetical protein [Deinococcus aluminii]|uniref:Uncharacterized protein n=1 Tax=Deinococcus aluminii TaxID=1656885 RepID=A0ABP9XEP4_9DEIO
MTHTAPRSSPPLSVHTPTRTSNAKIEVNAAPGTPLGGPLCTGVPRAGCRKVRPDEIGPQHLAYLRRAYLADHAVRTELDRLAGQHRYGRNHIAVFALDEVVAENVLRAIRGLAGQLPYWEALEAS